MLKRTPLKTKSVLKRTTLKKSSKKQSKKEYAFRKISKDVVSRDDGRCVLCGKPYDEIHHITYRSAGGSNELNNLCCLCWYCHRVRIHDSDHPKEMRKWLQNILAERHGYEY